MKFNLRQKSLDDFNFTSAYFTTNLRVVLLAVVDTLKR